MAGSTVVEKNLDRLTVVVALVFIFTTRPPVDAPRLTSPVHVRAFAPRLRDDSAAVCRARFPLDSQPVVDDETNGGTRRMFITARTCDRCRRPAWNPKR